MCEICEGEGALLWNNLTVICPKCDGKNSKVSCADCDGTGDDDPVFGGSCKKCSGLGYILPGHNTKWLYNYWNDRAKRDAAKEQEFRDITNKDFYLEFAKILTSHFSLGGR